MVLLETGPPTGKGVVTIKVSGTVSRDFNGQPKVFPRSLKGSVLTEADRQAHNKLGFDFLRVRKIGSGSERSFLVRYFQGLALNLGPLTILVTFMTRIGALKKVAS